MKKVLFRIGFGLFGAALLGLGFAALTRRLDKASYQLRLAAQPEAARVIPRPSHVEPPVEGTFGEHWERLKNAPVLERLTASRAKNPGAPAELSAMTAGARPDLRPFGLEASKAIATVEHCLDALALGRDLAHGGGLEGLYDARDFTFAVTEACGRVLDAAGADEKEAAVDRIQAILRGAPSHRRAMVEAGVDAQLETWGQSMREEDRAALPPAAKALAATAPVFEGGLVERIRLGLRWFRAQRTLHDLVEASGALGGVDELEASLPAELSRPTSHRPRGLRFHCGALADARRQDVLQLLISLIDLERRRRADGSWPARFSITAQTVPDGANLRVVRHPITCGDDQSPAFEVVLHPDE